MKETFEKQVINIAIPVALQSMLQSSFSMIDQIMVGQLGEKSIAAVEIAGKPGFIYSVVVGAVCTIAGIMISQYIGKKDRESEEKSICVNFLVMMLTGIAFFFISRMFPLQFIRLFTNDARVISEGSVYLGIIGWTFIPLGITNIFGAAIRCRGKSSWPLYVGFVSATLNTGLNYCLIFGNYGMPMLGVKGAAYASVISQVAGAVLIIVMFFRLYGRIRYSVSLGKENYWQYLSMLIPIVINEFLWSVGQSINTFVYGHMSTDELAGMSLTGSLQGLTIGALSGIAQAAGILVGKRLGEGQYDQAYQESKKLCVYGFIGSILFSVTIMALKTPYVHLFNVSDDVRAIGLALLTAFAVLMPIKVLNMILGGGIIRSGGRTKYIMMIDMLGTWLIGVPIALVTGLVFKFPIVWVYFMLSQEEVVRFIISIFMFRSRKWMNTIK
ncbi:MAG: MATE family efflux transporter [Parasporobacterium sp.]|jgi:putative efflux protein, MATE family|nr:MATE family efflux transporter [Parasporobacterium sp.]